ncbi:enamine deaminase RidA [Bermanella sp. 47_1433_sub80_T6]|nr:enamine deaminase RidA [Bermanella sp. 47_1433_sub80_T6]
MKRTPINPWSWSLNVGYHQAELLEGSKRQLICAGQTAVDAEGNPQHLEDMRKQIRLALDNLEAVLRGAHMGLANITRLNIYTTDVDEAMKHFDVFGARFGPINAAPPMTLLGVTRLAIPGLMFEIEATAAD